MLQIMYLKVFAALCISTCVDTEFSNYITEVLVKFNSEKEKEKKKKQVLAKVSAAPNIQQAVQVKEKQQQSSDPKQEMRIPAIYQKTRPKREKVTAVLHLIKGEASSCSVQLITSSAQSGLLSTITAKSGYKARQCALTYLPT